MSSVNDGTLHHNYFIYKYSEQLYGNLVDMKNQVDSSHELVVKSIEAGPNLSVHIHKLTESNHARQKLYEALLNFAIEALGAVQEKKCDTGRPDSTALKLLTYSSNEAEGTSLGTLVRKGYEPPALSIDANRPCRCVHFKCPKCIQDEQARATEAGASGDNPSPEPTVVDHPSSEDLPQSMSDLRLSLLMKEEPAPWDDLPPSPQPSYPSSVSSLNLRGPSCLPSLNLPGPGLFRHQVLLLPPKVLRPISDVHFHSAGAFLCSKAGGPESRGLWFQSKQTMQWEQVIGCHISRMCNTYRGTEAYTVSGEKGDNWVKKFDLKTGTPLPTSPQGCFQVSDGKKLIDISMCYGGRLAVCDYDANRVTVHELSGDLVCKLEWVASGGYLSQAISVCWFNEEGDRLLVEFGQRRKIWKEKVYDFSAESGKNFACFMIPSGDKIWGSCVFECQWWWRKRPIYSREDRIYFVTGDRLPYSIEVLSGESGTKIQELKWKEEAEPLRVVDVDGQLTVICFKRMK